MMFEFDVKNVMEQKEKAKAARNGQLTKTQMKNMIRMAF